MSTTITIRSRCHEYACEWTPENSSIMQSVNMALKRTGGARPYLRPVERNTNIFPWHFKNHVPKSPCWEFLPDDHSEYRRVIPSDMSKKRGYRPCPYCMKWLKSKQPFVVNSAAA